MQVYFVRHGQSESNLGGFFGGWAQVSLTEVGEKDALRAGRFLREISFDKVFSSDIRRAIQTQQLALPDAVCERTELLREFDVGSLEGRLIRDCQEELGPEFQANRFHYDFTTYGGESNAMVLDRVSRFMKRLEGENWETVAAFSHAGTIRSVLEYVTGVTIPKQSLLCRNGGIFLFDYTDGKWRLECWNL